MPPTKNTTDPRECRTCHVVKAASEFRGSLSQCRKCGSQESMRRHHARTAIDPDWRRRYHAENKEAINARVRASRAAKIEADPSYRDRLKSKSAREEGVEYWRRYYAENRAAYAESRKRYEAAHPEVMALKGTRRRACFASIVNDLTAQDIADVFAEFNHACAYCLRTDRKLTVDHMEPVSKGGGNTRSNIVPACLSCNSSKSDKSIFWMLNRAAA